MTNKLLQVGDLVRADRSLVRAGMNRVKQGTLYKVRNVRDPGNGEPQDITLVGVIGWWSAGSFSLESVVPDHWRVGMFVRRMKASHNGAIQGATYRIEAINRKLGLIKVEGIKNAFRASSFELVGEIVAAGTAARLDLEAIDRAIRATHAAAPAPQQAKTVGWKDEDGNITVNPNVAAEWITGGRKSKVERVYVLAA